MRRATVQRRFRRRFGRRSGRRVGRRLEGPERLRRPEEAPPPPSMFALDNLGVPLVEVRLDDLDHPALGAGCPLGVAERRLPPPGDLSRRFSNGPRRPLQRIADLSRRPAEAAEVLAELARWRRQRWHGLAFVAQMAGQAVDRHGPAGCVHKVASCQDEADEHGRRAAHVALGSHAGLELLAATPLARSGALLAPTARRRRSARGGEARSDRHRRRTAEMLRRLSSPPPEAPNLATLRAANSSPPPSRRLPRGRHQHRLRSPTTALARRCS